MCITEPEWMRKYWDQIPHQWRYLSLKDYPRNKWLPGAGKCEGCGAQPEIQITDVDPSGNFGTVQIRIRHKESCYQLEMEGQDPGLDYDMAGWEFKEKPIKLLGREYWPLKVRANVGPCLKCWKLIPGTPLILFLDQGRGGELDFCFECAEELGLLKMALGRAF